MNDQASTQNNRPRSVLQIENLTVELQTKAGRVRVLDGLNLDLGEGETLGLVGESGSGKSMTALALMGLLPEVGQISAGQVRFGERDLTQLSAKDWQTIRGRRIAMIFQDPMSSLNPCYTIERQIDEVLVQHQRPRGRQRVLDLLRKVGIPDPARRLESYPHQLSGGMSQRVMIAMALAGEPELLIADEPTTALDVTIQAQILVLLKSIQRETGMAMILISHDLGVVAQMADRIAILYAGHLMEVGAKNQIIKTPTHPYTIDLLRSIPSRQPVDQPRVPLPTIPGLVPHLADRPKGCQYQPRCGRAVAQCSVERPAWQSVDLQAGRACFVPGVGE